MDWSKIKEGAKEKINGHLWDLWKPILIISLITGVVQAIARAAFGDTSVAYVVVNVIASIILVPASVGQYLYVLNFIRGKKFKLSDLTEYYDKFIPILIISILVSLFTMLGFILLVIPGIIIALSYTMVLYIFADNKEIEPTACLSKSKEMMNGYKWDFFCFVLSFIGWIILCALVIPMIWVIPYVTTAEAMYYDELKKKTK